MANNESNETTNVTIPYIPTRLIEINVGNQTIIMNITTDTGYTQISGEVLNITFFPSFDIDLGIVRCMFTPFESPELAGAKYQLVCDFRYDISEDEVYVAIPASMLKWLESIQIDENDLVASRNRETLYLTLLIILAVVLAIYFLWNEAWDYKRE